jgi:hypothetical protein
MHQGCATPPLLGCLNPRNYILEPFVMHRLFHNLALREKHRAFALVTRLHVIALCVSAFTNAAGVLGSLGSLP